MFLGVLYFFGGGGLNYYFIRTCPSTLISEYPLAIGLETNVGAESVELFLVVPHAVLALYDPQEILYTALQIHSGVLPGPVEMGLVHSL